MKYKNHNDVARNNQHSQEDNNHHFQKAKIDSFQIAKCQEAERAAALITIQGGVHLELRSDLSLHAAAWLLPTVQRSSRCHCSQLCVSVKAPQDLSPQAGDAAALVHCLQCTPPLNPGPGRASSSCMASPRRGHRVRFTIHRVPGGQGKFWVQYLQASEGRG